MTDLPYWRLELDGADQRVKCNNCDQRVIESDLSRDGLCQQCVDAAQTDAWQLYLSSMRPL